MSSPSDLIGCDLYRASEQATIDPEVPMPRSPQADSEGRKLSNFLCFAIYSANLAFGRAYKPILDELGLTYTQYIAMVALVRGGRPDRRGARREAVPGIQHADAHPQEARVDRLHPASARSRRRTAGAGEPDGRRPPSARKGSRRVAGRSHRARSGLSRGAEDGGQAARQPPARHAGRTGQTMIVHVPLLSAVHDIGASWSGSPSGRSRGR